MLRQCCKSGVQRLMQLAGCMLVPECTFKQLCLHCIWILQWKDKRDRHFLCFTCTPFCGTTTNLGNRYP